MATVNKQASFVQFPPEQTPKIDELADLKQRVLSACSKLARQMPW
jgi:hypothetical protein